MTPTDPLVDLPDLEPGEVLWRPTNTWRYSGPMELRSGDQIIAEAEWSDIDKLEWRVDAGRRELAFRIAGWKPMRIEVAALPDDELELVHQGSKRRPRPAIQMGTSRYYLVKSGFGKTSYLDGDGTLVARMRSNVGWHGGTAVSIQAGPCPPWHLWALTCYAGFRVAVSYKHMFKADSGSGLRSLIGRTSDYDFG